MGDGYVSDVPQDFDELWRKHRRFFLHVIREIIPPGPDIEDVMQTALMAVITRDYLQECRTYEAACRARGEAYSVLSSLRPQIRNITRNYVRDQMAAKRDRRKAESLHALLVDSREKHDARMKRVPKALRVEATQVDQVCAIQRIDRLRQRLAASRCVIGGVPALEVFDEALRNGGEMDKYQRRRIKAVLGDEAHA